MPLLRGSSFLRGGFARWQRSLAWISEARDWNRSLLFLTWRYLQVWVAVHFGRLVCTLTVAPQTRRFPERACSTYVSETHVCGGVPREPNACMHARRAFNVQDGSACLCCCAGDRKRGRWPRPMLLFCVYACSNDVILARRMFKCSRRWRRRD